MLKYRLLKEEDYHTLCKWWKDNRFPIPPRDFLPNNGLDGIIVYKGDTELAAGFIYETSANKLAWIEYIVANFEVKDKVLRKEAKDFLIQSLIDIARNMNKKYLFSSLKKESLIKDFEDNGFSKGFNNTTEVVMSI